MERGRKLDFRAVRGPARWMRLICGAAACAGAAILFAAAAVTGASIVGRALSGLGLAPVRGDFELVEIATALAVFAFLPWCQLTRSHVTVDILSERFGARVHAALGFLGDLVLTLCSAVLLWQIWLGFGERYPHGGPGVRAALGMPPPPFFAETTYELQIPVWIVQGATTVLAALFFVTCLYTAGRSLRWTLAGQEPGSAP